MITDEQRNQWRRLSETQVTWHAGPMLALLDALAACEKDRDTWAARARAALVASSIATKHQEQAEDLHAHMVGLRKKDVTDIGRLEAERDAAVQRAEAAEANLVERRAMHARTVDGNRIALSGYAEREREMQARLETANRERDAAVQQVSQLVGDLQALAADYTNAAADTERRVVEEIAEWLEGRFSNRREMVTGIRTGAYRKQGARDG